MADKKKSAIREHYEAANRQPSSPATIQDIIESHELVNRRAEARNTREPEGGETPAPAKPKGGKKKR